jgi:hypothetical protein
VLQKANVEEIQKDNAKPIQELFHQEKFQRNIPRAMEKIGK